MTDLRPTSAIKVGDDRYRKVLGDIDGLAASIHDIGLLHPIVITPQNELIAGGRRLAAYKRLGRKEIPKAISRSPPFCENIEHRPTKEGG